MDTLTEKLRKMIRKDRKDALEKLEEEWGLTDDCKYLLYYSSEYTDGECAGGTYPVNSLKEAKSFIENNLERVKKGE